MSRPAESPRLLLAVAVLALAAWLWVTVPLATGERTFYYRDVFTVHMPLKAFGAAQLAEGRIPAFESGRALGQPFRGNPQAAAFYPGNVLYGLLPFWSAFNLHYALHWLLAFAAMALLARRLGLAPPAVLLAALAYGGGGWTLTALGFHHIIAVTAWWPLVLWGAVVGDRRGLGIAGLALGFALLAGAPEVVALGLVPLVGVTLSAHRGRRRALLSVAAILALGSLIALPQLVAFGRILPDTFRAVAGAEGAAAGLYRLAPLRFLELVLPLPFGWPGDLGDHGFWSAAAMPRVPLILSLYVGLPALVAALCGLRRAWGWGLLAGAGLVAACWGGPLLAAISGGLFRYPEKLLFWPALALPLLAGFGLEAALRHAARLRLVLRFAGLGGLLAAAFFMLRGTAFLAPWIRPGLPPETAAVQAELWAWSLLFAAAIALLLGELASRRMAASWTLCQLVSVLLLSPLVMTDEAAPYRQPSPWQATLPAGAALVSAAAEDPFRSGFGYRPEDSAVAARLRLGARDLDRVPGVERGFRYPLAVDFDGLVSPDSTRLLINLPQLPATAREAWLRRLGVEAVIAGGPPPASGLTAVERSGEVSLYRVERPAPALWWPQRVAVAAGPQALIAASQRLDPLAVVTAPRPVAHGSGRVELVSQAEDRLVFEVEGEGGLVVLRRAFQPLYRARIADRPLATVPVDLLLLGVEVPAGRHRVEVTVSSRPEMLAAGASVATLLGILTLAWPLGHRRAAG
ncbi:MAG: hypothetical protein AAF604_07065 [Acidobacteriota bacterium]